MKKLLLSAIVSLLFLYVSCQTSETNILTPSLPFLNIYNNTELAGFGGIGAVSSDFKTDAGLFQNPANLSRNTQNMGLVFSFYPWLREFFPDANVKTIGIFYAFNPKHAIGITTFYLNWGNIDFADEYGNYFRYRPIEYYYQLHYKYNFTERTSIGAGIKYISSDFSPSFDAVKTFSIDLGYSYSHFFHAFGTDVKYNTGISILNFGPKVNYYYGSFKYHQPTNLMLGILLNPAYNLTSKLTLNIELAYQAEKLLIPTPPQYDLNGNIIEGKDPNISPFRALYQSFYDAPGGFNEEWHEIIHKFGNEFRLSFNNKIHLAFRYGISREHITKGNRRYNNYGFGLNMYGFFIGYTKVLRRNVSSFNQNMISFGLKCTPEDFRHLF